MFANMLQAGLMSGLLDTAGDYLGSGMDYISKMMPERQKMKSYIEGDVDDRVIDYVADKWNALRGLLGPEPYEREDLAREQPYNPMSEYFTDLNPFNPMSEYMDVLKMPARRYADVFKNDLEIDPLSGGMRPKGGYDLPQRPRIMDALETANQIAPRPLTGVQDVFPPKIQRDYSDYKRLRELTDRPLPPGQTAATAPRASRAAAAPMMHRTTTVESTLPFYLNSPGSVRRYRQENAKKKAAPEAAYFLQGPSILENYRNRMK